MKEEKVQKLVQYLGGYLLVNQQAQVNVQKVVDAMSDDSKERIYAMVTADLSARMKQQRAAIDTQIKEMSE